MTMSTRRNVALAGAACSLLIGGALIGCRGGGKSPADKTATSVAAPAVTRTAAALATAYPSGTPKGGRTSTSGSTPGAGGTTGPGGSTPGAGATSGAGTTPGAGATPGGGTTPGSEPTLPPGTTVTPGTPQPTQTVVVLPGGVLGVAIDADPSSPTTVEASTSRPLGAIMIGINFLQTADQPEFAGFDLEIASDNPSVLTLDKTESGLTSPSGVPWGCGPAHLVQTGPPESTHVTCIVNAATTRYTGQGMTFAATCVSAGTAHVHLVRGTATSTGSDASVEDDTFGTSFLSDPGTYVKTLLVDAEIICG